MIMKPKPRCQSKRAVYESPRTQFLKFSCLFSKKIFHPYEMHLLCDVTCICGFHTYYYMFFHLQRVHIPSRTYRCNYPDCYHTLGCTFPDQHIRLDLKFSRKKLFLKYFVCKREVYSLDLPCKSHICIVQTFIQNLTTDF